MSARLEKQPEYDKHAKINMEATPYPRRLIGSVSAECLLKSQTCALTICKAQKHFPTSVKPMSRQGRISLSS